MNKSITHTELTIKLKDISLRGILSIPKNAEGIVIFSHGSGSSRLSTRNNFVARTLNNEGLATLLFDLLTFEEDMIYANRFDIDLLTSRLVQTTQWVQQQEKTPTLSIGYFGSSTGAASALLAAGILGNQIHAVVSRGGRTDLAIPDIRNVIVPTLFIVGELDKAVISLNKEAYEYLTKTREFVIIPGASHLFEEAGTLEQVSEVATKWFKKWLSPTLVKNV
ncbi:alpha/beta hydrolase [Spongiivirga sp. MCCC 1A20706]|uniref:dienelactone hydrolase family protein n=1 Tax=Spongiivirga sp. MCCC 1A20706 TaxID=3160963 RepID=UPI0039776C0F